MPASLGDRTNFSEGMGYVWDLKRLCTIQAMSRLMAVFPILYSTSCIFRPCRELSRRQRAWAFFFFSSTSLIPPPSPHPTLYNSFLGVVSVGKNFIQPCISDGNKTTVIYFDVTTCPSWIKYNVKWSKDFQTLYSSLQHPFHSRVLRRQPWEDVVHDIFKIPDAFLKVPRHRGLFIKTRLQNPANTLFKGVEFPINHPKQPSSSLLWKHGTTATSNRSRGVTTHDTKIS